MSLRSLFIAFRVGIWDLPNESEYAFDLLTGVRKMTHRPLLIWLILMIGFLTSSTVYFYSKSRSNQVNKSGEATFSAELPQLTASQSSQKIDELTKPAEPRGRLSYPKNVYTVSAKETLFSIGSLFGLDWKLIKRANSTTNENLIQAGYTLAIPRLEATTDYYRLNFMLDEKLASQTNQQASDGTDNSLFNPVEVARKNAVGYFGLTANDEFTLLEQDDSRGTALVEAKNSNTSTVVGLFQPKTKGKKGFWTVLYIELRR